MTQGPWATGAGHTCNARRADAAAPPPPSPPTLKGLVAGARHGLEAKVLVGAAQGVAGSGQAQLGGHLGGGGLQEGRVVRLLGSCRSSRGWSPVRRCKLGGRAPRKLAGGDLGPSRRGAPALGWDGTSACHLMHAACRAGHHAGITLSGCRLLHHAPAS